MISLLFEIFAQEIRRIKLKETFTQDIRKNYAISLSRVNSLNEK